MTPVGFPHLCDKAKKDLMSRPAKRDTYSSRDTSIAGYSSAFPVLLVGWQIKPQDFAAAAEPDAQTAHADGECACGARHVGRGTPRVAVSCGHGHAARRRSSCANVPNPYTAHALPSSRASRSGCLTPAPLEAAVVLSSAAGSRLLPVAAWRCGCQASREAVHHPALKPLTPLVTTTSGFHPQLAAPCSRLVSARAPARPCAAATPARARNRCRRPLLT